jgi:hypothetical protein
MISLTDSQRLRPFIEKQLQDRGLKLDYEELDEWEDHRYKTKNNQLKKLFIGYAIEPAILGASCHCNSKVLINRDCGAHDQSVFVMIQGNRVFELEELNRWSNRIPIPKPRTKTAGNVMPIKLQS